MAHHMEPMDVDMAEDKENSFQNNVQTAEKGNEELDSSEINMKLRYSMTPLSSPMSKSYTVQSSEKTVNDENNPGNRNPNMTRSLNTTVSRETPKTLPLQVLNDSFDDPNRTAAVLRSIDSVISDGGNVTVTVTHDSDVSYPSSSSEACTPEATTPTKEIPKPQGSPIMRGLKSVLNIFRTSQSPIPPDENELRDDSVPNIDLPSSSQKPQEIIASTPLVTNKKDKENLKKDSIAFKDDLEKQLQWNDDDTIIFTKKEKIPIYKLLFPNAPPIPDTLPTDVSMAEENTNVTNEAMDVSYNDSVVKSQLKTENQTQDAVKNASAVSEKDESVFLDCESTLNETQLLEGTIPINTNITYNPDKSIDVNTALDETNPSMESAEALADLNKTATEESQETVNASIDSVKINLNTTETIVATPLIKVEEPLTVNPDETQSLGLPTDDVSIRAQITFDVDKPEETEQTVQTPEIAETSIISEVVEGKDEKVYLNTKKLTEQDQIKLQDDSKLEYNKDVIEATMNVTNNSENMPITIPILNDPENINNSTNATFNVSVKNESIPTTLLNQTVDLALEAKKFESNVTVTTEEYLYKNKLDYSTETTDKNNKNPVENIPLDTTTVVKHDETDKIPNLIENLTENQVTSEINKATNEESLKEVGIDTEIKPTSTDTSMLIHSDQNQIEINQEDFLVQTKIETDSAIETSMVLSSIKITDDAVVISTPNNKTMQVPNTTEDISMVDADFLVPQDDNDSEETSINNLEDNIQNTKINISDTVSEIIQNKTTNDKDEIAIECDGKNEANQVPVLELQTQKSESAQEEEIIVSESSSPYVSLKPDEIKESIPETTTFEENAEEINAFVSIERTNLSPPITSRGYNFNFDEMDDPFATKTKVKLSPALNTSKTIDFDKTFEPIEKVTTPKIKMPLNKPKVTKQKPSPKLSAKKHQIEDEINSATNDITFNINKSDNGMLANKEDKSGAELSLNANNTVVIFNKTDTTAADDLSPLANQVPNTHLKETSSSEQSTYFSLGSSTGDTVEPKITIPVFDEDSIINPFVTKSKMRLSPPPSETIVEAINNALSKENIETVQTYHANNLTLNQFHETCSDSSKSSDDKNDTVRDINTEDEDTIEGPFIEAALTADFDKLPDFENERVELDEFKDLPAQVEFKDLPAKVEFKDLHAQLEFKDLPAQEGLENAESGEMFIDAEAFEFLMSQNRSNEVADSGKESLFLKFDPLFAKRINSDGVLEVLSKIQKRQSTPKKLTPRAKAQLRQDDNAAGPSNATVEMDIPEVVEDLNMLMPQKPTMMVPPAVNQVVAPKHRPTTPTRPQRRSMTFTSPAMAVIDRLLTLSANNTPSGIDNTALINAEREEADHALAELRELLAEKELNVHHLRCESKELKDRLMTLQSQMTNLEEESERRLKNINELEDRLTEKHKHNKSMEAVVEEYERTIAGLIAETEADKKSHAEERMQLIKERDEQTAHLASMEVAFSDLHSKYEKSKQIIYAYKAKEDEYRKSVLEFEENLLKMQNNYELLKQHATLKLNHANTELEKINKAHESEVLKFSAMIKRKDLHITSLEESLAQKTKANEELTAICDELINKVG